MKKGDIVYYARPKGTAKPLRAASNLRELKSHIPLLWGDMLFVTNVSTNKIEVSAKGHILELPEGDVMPQPLLSLYQIDCGQGDAALLHTPDGRWVMIDGGPSPSMNNSAALGVQFLLWKMYVDQSWRKEFGISGPFKLDALVVSHPDEDHFGGFPNIISHVKLGRFEIGTIFHNGMGRFDGDTVPYNGTEGFGQLGPVKGDALPNACLTTLIDDASDIKAYMQPTSSRNWKLTGNYAKFLDSALAKVGAGIGGFRRVDHTTGHLPGFASGNGNAAIRVLGPVVETIGAHQGLRYLDSAAKIGSPSLTRNGHSIVLRIDHGAFRLLMTGDLNFKSHAVLLQNIDPKEFECQVAKACHHGAEDISTTFLQAMNPMATLFSSGDNEGYAHPRAKALAFSAAFSRKLTKGTNSFLNLKEPKYLAPLIYSTEISRSVQLHEVHSVQDAAGKRIPKANLVPVVRAYSGAPRKAGKPLPSSDWLLASSFIYGLVNVRTDGKKVVIGVLKEGDADFQIEDFTL